MANNVPKSSRKKVDNDPFSVTYILFFNGLISNAEIVNIYYVMGFRSNYFTCIAHLYLYYTLLVPHTYVSYTLLVPLSQFHNVFLYFNSIRNFGSVLSYIELALTYSNIIILKTVIIYNG